MTVEDDTATIEDAQENADFASGFSTEPPAGKPAETLTPDKPNATAPEKATETAKEEVPEYVQISARDWAEVRAAAAKTASYDQQLSKAFGTIGNLQKLVNESRAPGRKVEIPKDAFAAMERDFPELAQQTRQALEAALSGVANGHGANDADTARFESLLATYTAKREMEILEDAHPNWREVVGAVDVTQAQPDPNNPFRKWLGTKDAAYQNRVNNTESAAVIGRAIRTFQNETKATAKPAAAATPRDTARAERIRSAVQPRGDNAGAAPGKTDDDEFMAGFNSR